MTSPIELRGGFRCGLLACLILGGALLAACNANKALDEGPGKDGSVTDGLPSPNARDTGPDDLAVDTPPMRVAFPDAASGGAGGMSGGPDAGGVRVPELTPVEACKQDWVVLCHKFFDCFSPEQLQAYASVIGINATDCQVKFQASECTPDKAACEIGTVFHPGNARLCTEGLQQLSCTEVRAEQFNAPAACDVMCIGPTLGGGGAGFACVLNSECSAPLACTFGRCHAQCNGSGDCPLGQRCVNAATGASVCQLDDEKSCRNGCGSPLSCAVDGQCRNECRSAIDCPRGQRCASGACAEPDEVTPDGRLIGGPDAGGGRG